MGVTVRQKKKGKGNPWWVFISHDGKRTSRKVGDKKAAQVVAEKIQAKLQLGEFDLNGETKKTVPTFKTYSEKYMDTYSTLNHKPSTHDSYRSTLDIHLLPAFGEKDLDRITRSDIKAFISGKRKEGLSSGTVRNFKAYLSSILSEAVDDEIIPFNPAARTGKMIKKDDKPEIRPFTWEEMKRFEDTIKDHFPRYYPFFLTALRTGMRLGELLALKPGDLDFNGGLIEIRRSYTKGRITTPKNGKSRPVDMSRQLQDVLKKHLTDRKKETLKNGWQEPPEYLFYSEAGRMLDGDNLRRRTFKRALGKAGLRHIRIHDLRHTYASLRVAKGDNLQDISKQLGHHSVKFTLDVYSHWLPGSNKKQIDELDSNDAPGCTLYAPCDENAKEKGAAF